MGGKNGIHQDFFASAAILIFAGYSAAADLSGDEIRTILSGNTITAQDEVQYFNPNGTTIYEGYGERSNGWWMTEGNQYCSTVSGFKRCYPVTGNSEKVTFTAKGKSYSYMVTKGQHLK